MILIHKNTAFFLYTPTENIIDIYTRWQLIKQKIKRHSFLDGLPYKHYIIFLIFYTLLKFNKNNFHHSSRHHKKPIDITSHSLKYILRQYHRIFQGSQWNAFWDTTGCTWKLGLTDWGKRYQASVFFIYTVDWDVVTTNSIYCRKRGTGPTFILECMIFPRVHWRHFCTWRISWESR